MTPLTRILVAALVGLAVAAWPRGPARARRPGGAGRALLSRRSPTSRDTSGRGPATAAAGGEVAATCELVALALASGVGIDAALEAVAAATDPPAAGAVRTILASRQWGLAPPEQAGLAPPWLMLARALQLADTAGVPPAASLRRTVADLRARRLHRLEVATTRLRVLIVLPLGLCFLPAFVLTTVVPIVLALAGRVTSP